MGSYLIDTNVSLGYFSETLPKSGLDFLDQVINSTPKISVITKIELLGFNATTAETEFLNKFIDHSLVLDITKEVVEATIVIRKQRKIKIPDAIIAATALVFDFELLSRNTEDFKGITGLRVVNPWQLNPQ